MNSRRSSRLTNRDSYPGGPPSPRGRSWLGRRDLLHRTGQGRGSRRRAAGMAIGELGYWPVGAAFCIFWGPTRPAPGPCLGLQQREPFREDRRPTGGCPRGAFDREGRPGDQCTTCRQGGDLGLLELNAPAEDHSQKGRHRDRAGDDEGLGAQTGAAPMGRGQGTHVQAAVSPERLRLTAEAPDLLGAAPARSRRYIAA